MRNVEPSWQGVALVCSHQRDPATGRASCGAAGSALRKALRDRLRSEGLKGEHLVVTSGCLGICSPQGVTLSVLAPGGERLSLVVSPDDDLDTVWQRVRACMLSPAPHQGN